MSQRQKHTAIAYDKRGKVISIGKNSYVTTHTLQARFAKQVGRPESVFLHAEIDCLIRARGRPVHRIFVTRIDPDGNYALAKPCPICQQAIKAFGVKVIEHT